MILITAVLEALSEYCVVEGNSLINLVSTVAGDLESVIVTLCLLIIDNFFMSQLAFKTYHRVVRQLVG